MRCQLFTILTITASGCGSAARDAVVHRIEKDAAPQIDLCAQELGTSRIYIFSVPNQTGSDLNIAGYQSSCNCIELEIQNPIVGIGGEAVLRCTIEASDGFAGQFAFEIALQCTTGTVKELPFVLLIRFVDKSPSWSALTLEEHQ